MGNVCDRHHSGRSGGLDANDGHIMLRAQEVKPMSRTKSIVSDLSTELVTETQTHSTLTLNTDEAEKEVPTEPTTSLSNEEDIHSKTGHTEMGQAQITKQIYCSIKLLLNFWL